MRLVFWLIRYSRQLRPSWRICRCNLPAGSFLFLRCFPSRCPLGPFFHCFFCCHTFLLLDEICLQQTELRTGVDTWDMERLLYRRIRKCCQQVYWGLALLTVSALKYRLDPQDFGVAATTAGVSISYRKLSKRQIEDYPNKP